MFNIKDFLSSNRAGKIVNFDKDTVLETIQPDGFQLYNLYDSWRMAIINSKTKARLSMKFNKSTDTKAGIDVPKNIQESAAALNNATKVLEITPADVNAKKAVANHAPIVAAWLAETFDSPDNYIYAGETEEGRKFCVLSPNAPGENSGIATVAFSSSLVTP